MSAKLLNGMVSLLPDVMDVPDCCQMNTLLLLNTILCGFTSNL